MDQEKETKRQAERCHALAQRIVRELTPASIQVLGGSGALAEALEKTGAQLLPENAELGTAALLVVEDPEWVDLPALQCAPMHRPWLTVQSSWLHRAFTVILSGRTVARPSRPRCSAAAVQCRTCSSCWPAMK